MHTHKTVSLTTKKNNNHHCLFLERIYRANLGRRESFTFCFLLTMLQQPDRNGYGHRAIEPFLRFLFKIIIIIIITVARLFIFNFFFVIEEMIADKKNLRLLTFFFLSVFCCLIFPNTFLYAFANVRPTGNGQIFGPSRR